MKTIAALSIFASCLFFLGGPAKAAPIITSDSTETIYQQVLDYFNKGTAPTQEQVTGVFSGRCYTSASPNMPTAGLLIGVGYPTAGDNGPLFPAQAVFKILRAPNPDSSQAANVYDSMSPSLQSMITSLTTDAQRDNYTPAAVVDGSLVTVNTEGNLAYTVRMHENYFFTKDTIVRTDSSNKAGDIYTACYFFKKIN